MKNYKLSLFVLLALFSLTNITAGEPISTETVEANQAKRLEISNERIVNALILFKTAVAKFDEGDIAGDIDKLETLTDSLESATTSISPDISDDKNIASAARISEKRKAEEKVLKVNAKKAHIAYTKENSAYIEARNAYNKIKHSRRMIDVAKKAKLKNAVNAALKRIRAAKRALSYANSKIHTFNAQQARVNKQLVKNGNKTGNEIKEDEKQRAALLRKGELLFLAKQKLLDKINNRALTATAAANQARDAALALLGVKVNNNFEDLQNAGLANSELDLLKRVAKENEAHAHISQYALSAGTAQLFRCSDISDTKCVSYPLMVAAHAIYLATTIYETSDYNANTSDILEVEDTNGETGDEQYELMVRAAKVREEVIRTAEARLQSGNTLADMLADVDNVARIELRVKVARVIAAKKQVKKARKNRKKVIYSLGIVNALKLIFKDIIADSLRKIIKYGACSHKSSCRRKMRKTKSLWKQATSLLKMYLYYIPYFIDELRKADKKVEEAKKELKAANIHTHMKCSNSGTAPLAHYSKKLLKRNMLLASMILSFSASTAYADAPAADAAAIGALDSSAIYKYYQGRKTEETLVVSVDFQVPETRATYMEDIATNSADDSNEGLETILTDLRSQADYYNQIVDNMPNSGEIVSGGNVDVEQGETVVVPTNQDFSFSGAGFDGGLSSDPLKSSSDSMGTLDAEGGVLGSTASNRQAANLVKKVKDSHKKAESILKLSSKKGNKGNKDAWAAHKSNIEKALKSRFPKYKSGLSNSKLNKFAKSSAAIDGGDSSNNKSDNSAKFVETKIDFEGGSEQDNDSSLFGIDDYDVGGTGGKMSKDELYANLLANGESCSSAQYKNDPIGCAKLDAELEKKRILAALDKNNGKYNNGTATNEFGIYNGDKTLFNIISNRYIKSAIPVFFTEKRKAKLKK